MKTTIELPDDLFQRAKQLAATNRTTLRELVVCGLERELAGRGASGHIDFHWVTVSGTGLQVPASEAIAASYELPA